VLDMRCQTVGDVPSVHANGAVGSGSCFDRQLGGNYELTPAQSRKDGLYGSGSPAVHHHNVENWGRAQDWQHEHIEQDEQTGHDESDFAVAVAISDSRSNGNAD